MSATPSERLVTAITANSTEGLTKPVPHRSYDFHRGLNKEIKLNSLRYEVDYSRMVRPELELKTEKK